MLKRNALPTLRRWVINKYFLAKTCLRGSGKLHFMPLAGNSQFTLQSKWLSPSFDGNIIPSSRKIDKTGFSANWLFNEANLPFSTLITGAKTINASLAFGVSLLQPGNEYAQTGRCIKYAILLIGLSFALFFIMEIMQQKPVHPIQYVLVGFALIIFYTLLLSISEIASFNLAYFVASSATILLITVYVHSHFQQVKTAAYFTLLLSLLYGFIFIVLRLEDTALLVGSIGLFIILAIVMYASRHVNWYQSVSRTAPFVAE
ncbi:MAG: cell envelope integrity protein CreD [Bacteroidota bacterium]